MSQNNVISFKQWFWGPDSGHITSYEYNKHNIKLHAKPFVEEGT